MKRLEMIQKTLNALNGSVYLEIGVEFGTSFLRVKAKKKIAVDTKFRISFRNKIRFLKSTLKDRYFEMSSNQFFSDHAPSIFADNGIDAAFIDGLHTYEQSLEDVQNCLKYLNKRGIIIMHDCNPPSQAAASPSREMAKTLPGWNGSWCGDVWKTIVHLRSLRNDLEVFVINNESGLGVVTRGKPERMLEYSLKDIENLTYTDFNNNRKHILNLQEPPYMEDFLLSLTSR